MFKIITNYHAVNHEYNCEVTGENAPTLKIYNLMMLKKNDIKNFMIKEGLEK